MKHLKTFESFNEEDKVDEGLKDLGTGLLFTIASLFGNPANAGNDKGDHKTQQVTLHSQSEVNRYLKSGWKLTSSQIDTVWSDIKSTAPQSEVEAIQLHMDKDQLFASGSFILSDKSKKDIDSVLNVISENSGLLLKIDIESSTDKQQLTKNLQNILIGKGLTGDNQGLSEARSNSVKEYLTGKEIDVSLVNVENKSEQGIEEIQQSVRYVNVDFYYVKYTPPAPPLSKKLYVVKQQYEVEKEVPETKSHYKFGGSNATHKKLGPIAKIQKKISAIDCFTPGSHKIKPGGL